MADGTTGAACRLSDADAFAAAGLAAERLTSWRPVTGFSLPR